MQYPAAAIRSYIEFSGLIPEMQSIDDGLFTDDSY